MESPRGIVSLIVLCINHLKINNNNKIKIIIIMSEQERLEIAVKDWNLEAHTFTVAGVNPKLDDIRKSGKRIPLLVLKKSTNGMSVTSLRDVVLLSSSSSSDSYYIQTTY